MLTIEESACGCGDPAFEHMPRNGGVLACLDKLLGI